MSVREILNRIKEKGFNDELKNELIRDLNKSGLTRSYELVRENIDEENRTVPLAFSSDDPYERYWGVEILDHDPSSVRLERLNNSAAFLSDHNWRAQIGVIESGSVELGKDKKARCTVRFSKSANNILAQKEWDDTLDGIRTKISVGYEIHELVLEKSSDSDPNIYRVTDWEPLEISLVSIPADDTVGVGKGKDSDINQTDERILELVNTAIKNHENNKQSGSTFSMADENKPDQRSEEDILKARNQEVGEIMALCAKHNVSPDEPIKNGYSLARTKGWLVDNHLEKGKPIDTPAAGGDDLSKNELKSYNVWNLIRAAYERKPELAGLEMERSRNIAEKAQRSPNGYFIDADYLRQGNIMRALNLIKQVNPKLAREITVGAGTADTLVATELMDGEFVDLLYNQLLFGRDMGVRFIPGCVGDLEFPYKTTHSTGYWLGEGGKAAESDINFGSFVLTPKTISAKVKYSRKTMKQTTPAMQGIVLADVLMELKQTANKALIQGTGNDYQPLGFLNQDGVVYVDGSNYSFDKAVDMETALDEANVSSDNLVYATTPAGRGLLRKRPIVDGQTDKLVEKDRMNDLPVKRTGNMKADHLALLDPSDIIVCEWGTLDLDIKINDDDDGAAKIIPFYDIDYGHRRPSSIIVANSLS